MAMLLASCANVEEPVHRPTMSPTSVRPVSALVYYLAEQPTGLRLAHEPHPLRKDAAKSVVEAMIAGPDDPDYTSPWNRKTVVRGINTEGSVVTVDLDSAARKANIGSAGAELMVQQLVFTVTEVLGRRLKVRLLVDGEPAGELWGSVAWQEPVGRAAADDVRQVVQVDTPAEGTVMRSPVRVSGEAKAFEANVPWRVLDAKGRVVKAGHTSTAEGFVFSGFAFDVRLTPGTYTIEIQEDNPSAVHKDLTRDTRQITVR